MATATDTSKGSASGAQAVVKALAPGGTVPATWNSKNHTNTKLPGGYVLNTFTSKGVGHGTIQWGNLTPTETYSFMWNTGSNKLKGEATPDPGMVTELPLLGIPDAVGSGISTVGDLIAKITSPGLWKSIGLGAAGVAIIIVALALYFKGGLK